MTALFPVEHAGIGKVAWNIPNAREDCPVGFKLRTDRRHNGLRIVR